VSPHAADKALKDKGNFEMPTEQTPYDRYCGCGVMISPTGGDPFRAPASLLSLPNTAEEVVPYALGFPLTAPLSIDGLTFLGSTLFVFAAQSAIGLFAEAYLIYLSRPIDANVPDNPANTSIELAGLPAWPPKAG
jgi:hypothetical protein